MAKTQRFYTYFWLREDGTPYYVGKGKGDRAYISEGHGVHRPKDAARILVQHWESEQKAFDMEKWWIHLFGRQDLGTGILRNLTDGGEGQSGLVHSEETKKKMSQSHSGNTYSVGRKHPEETIQKMIASRTGGKRSEATKMKMSETRKLWWAKKREKEGRLGGQDKRSDLRSVGHAVGEN